jgi:hypothetical protein
LLSCDNLFCYLEYCEAVGNRRRGVGGGALKISGALLR